MSDLVHIAAGIPRNVLEEILDDLVAKRVEAVLATSGAAGSPWLDARAAADHLAIGYDAFKKQASEGMWTRHEDPPGSRRFFYDRDQLDQERRARATVHPAIDAERRAA